jgi:phenylacetate-CoA ligase
VKLEGGILGRVDDMLIVRGVNVFPSALEDVVRRFDDVVEFRIEAYTERGMDALRCTLEPRAGVDANGLAREVGDAIHRDIGVRADVVIAVAGSLPRFEHKAQRFTRRKTQPV